MCVASFPRYASHFHLSNSQGYELVVYDVNKSAMTNLSEAGAKCAASAAEMSRDAEVIMSMLPTNQHVLDVYTGADGILR